MLGFPDREDRRKGDSYKDVVQCLRNRVEEHDQEVASGSGKALDFNPFFRRLRLRPNRLAEPQSPSLNFDRSLLPLQVDRMPPPHPTSRTIHEWTERGIIKAFEADFFVTELNPPIAGHIAKASNLERINYLGNNTTPIALAIAGYIQIREVKESLLACSPPPEDSDPAQETKMTTSLVLSQPDFDPCRFDPSCPGRDIPTTVQMCL